MSADGEHKQVRVFISSISANQEVKQQQHRVLQTLEVKRIPFETKDIAVDQEAKREFRRLMRTSVDPRATTPQIVNGERLCGNYEAFYWAVEEERLKVFLLLEEPAKKPAPQPQQQQRPPENENEDTTTDQSATSVSDVLEADISPLDHQTTHDEDTSNTSAPPPPPPPGLPPAPLGLLVATASSTTHDEDTSKTSAPPPPGLPPPPLGLLVATASSDHSDTATNDKTEA